LERPVRVLVFEPDRVRAEEVPAGRFFAAAGAAAGRQMAQLSMKRLWRQKLGGTSTHSRRAARATFRALVSDRVA